MSTPTCPHLPGDTGGLLRFPAASFDSPAGRASPSFSTSPGFAKIWTSCYAAICSCSAPSWAASGLAGLCVSAPSLLLWAPGQTVASSLKCAGRGGAGCACPPPSPPSAAALWLLSPRPRPYVPLTVEVGPCLHCL